MNHRHCKRKWRRIALLGVAAWSIAAADTHANPLFAGADPSVIAEGQELWIFPTRNDKADRFEGWSSSDGTHWRQRSTLLSIDDVPWIPYDGVAHHGLWAPDVRRVANRYYLYFSVGPQGATPSRIGVATSERIEGPYRDSGRALLTGGNGFEAIDPMMFTDPKSGTHYLYAGGSAGAKLRVFVLKPDCVTIDHEVVVDQPPYFTEAAFMHERNGTYYLSYSHGLWKDSSYSVHYATGQSPSGPWAYQGSILSSDASHQGPGHHAFVQDPRSGRWLIMYHRWESPPTGGRPHGTRQIAVEPITYAQDGTILPIQMTDR
jgi:beta-xylosidase